MSQHNDIFNIKKKVYILTGASSGLGRETAIKLSSLGAELILIDIDADGLNETASRCESHVTKLICNLEDQVGSVEKIKTILSPITKISGFIHFAGLSSIVPLKTLTCEEMTKVYTINTLTAFTLAKLCSSKNVCSSNGSSFVLISSIYGLVGSPANLAYSMSKSALHGLVKSLAIELAEKKIRVNAIAPGFIKTEMLESIKDNFASGYLEKLSELHPLGLGHPNDIANACLFLISDLSKWTTGTIQVVDGGYTAR